MSIYKKDGEVYWFNFIFQGVRYQRSTKQRNRKVAGEMEAVFRSALAKGEMGIVERKKAPALRTFAQRFIDAIQVRSAAKPRTVGFYAEKLSRLLEFEPFADASLDKIDESLIES